MPKTKTNGHRNGRKRVQVRMYRRLNVQDHDPHMDEVISVIAREGRTPAEAATLSGVGPGTIQNWKKQNTRRPQHLTMQATLAGVGYGFAIRRIKKIIDYKTELEDAKKWIKKRDAQRAAERR